MKPLKIKDWFVFGEWYDIYWFHSCYFEGIAKTIKKFVGLGPSQAVIEQEGNIQRVYLSRSEWSNLGKVYLEKIILAPEKLFNLLNELRSASDELTSFSLKLNKIKFNKLNSAKQLELLKQYHQKHHRVWTLGQVANVLELENSNLTDYLKSWLLSQKIKGNELTGVFQILSMPRELSMAQKEERAMLELAVKNDSVRQIKAHWKKFRWIYFGWIGPGLELDYFIDVRKRLNKQGGAQRRLELILKRDRQLVIDKKRLARKLGMPDKILNLFRLLEEILFIKAYRMDALYLSYDACQPLLRQIGQTYHLSLRQVYSLDMEWLAKMAKNNKIDSHKINDLAKFSAQYYDGQKTYLLAGDAARRITNTIKKFLPPVKPVTELKGEVAYPGKVRGRIKVVNFAKEMNKFAAGDILVAYVTDPSLLPIMKKAKAFITNTGGLTCHAAIVARELRKPCIVGTKIATKVFKDGDLVEVDANLGVVRKIK